MCGIAGFWDFSQKINKDELTSHASKMGKAITHRGPDQHAFWCDENHSIAFAHQRLSILDLSEHGLQPMHSPSKRYTIVYNGEVYNYLKIADELKPHGYSFAGHSDTEVILAAIEYFGIKAAVEKFIGMFAFAIFDKQAQEIYLVRDRIGIKPLYWGFNNDKLFFSSELKALFATELFKPELDRAALSEFINYNYVPKQSCILENIHKLMPGTILKIDSKKNISEHKYWDVDKIYADAKSNLETQKSANDYILELEALLTDGIVARKISDVPIGTFLSGGIDSSLVTAILQHNSREQIKTFSIGFEDENFNEAVYAKDIANYLKTEHHELYFSHDKVMDLIPNLSSWYDEPFADVSQLPTFLVSKLAKDNITVALSGDGGDELFAGYNRYIFAKRIESFIANVPYPARIATTGLMQILPPDVLDLLIKVVPSKFRPTSFGDKLHKLAELFKTQHKQDLYKNMISFWPETVNMVQDTAMLDQTKYQLSYDQKFNIIEQMQLHDLKMYLPDDILTKVDRASMANSLEVRVPILDHRVIEFAARLPFEYKMRGNNSKWILKQILGKYIPEPLFNRPKMGFGVPIGSWLRGPLKDWGHELLNPATLKGDGLLNDKVITKRWQEHLKGTRNWQGSLWGVLMFQQWRQQWFG